MEEDKDQSPLSPTERRTLEIARRAHSDAERQIQRVAASIPRMDFGLSAFVESAQKAMAPLANAQLGLAANLIPAINTGKMMAAAMAPIADAHKTMAQAIQPLGGVAEAIHQTVGNFGRSIIDAVYGAKRALAESIRSVASWALRPFSIASVIGNIVPNISSFMGSLLRAPPFLGSFLDGLRPLGRIAQDIYEHFLHRTNYYLAKRAAGGDETAARLFTIKLYKQRTLYYKTQRAQGFEPSSSEFRYEVMRVCCEVLGEGKIDEIPKLEVGKRVRDQLTAELRAANAEFVESNFQKPGTHRAVLGEAEWLFVHTAADIAGVTKQTIRNWIKKGILPAEKIDYDFQTKRAFTKAFIIPYSPAVIRTLELARTGTALTAAKDVAKELKISTKTLTRLEQAGEVIPQRLGGRRFYTPDQVKHVAELKTRRRHHSLRNLNLRHAS